MKKLKNQHKGTILRKRKIIEAALACFTELGYNETNIADILRRANASIGSLYHHFGSKEQLAAEVYLEGIRDYQDGFLSALETESDAEKGIRAVIYYHLAWVERNRPWAQYFIRMRHLEFMALKEDEFTKLNEALWGRVASWFLKQITAGAIRRLTPDLYPAILMGPCQEFSRAYLEGKAVAGINDAAGELAAAAWRALGAEQGIQSRPA